MELLNEFINNDIEFELSSDINEEEDYFYVDEFQTLSNISEEEFDEIIVNFFQDYIQDFCGVQNLVYLF